MKKYRSGDFTARIWKLPGATTIMMDENGKPIYDEPAVLKHSTKVRPELHTQTHAHTHTHID